MSDSLQPPASLSFTICLLKLTFIELIMSPNHLILCCPLLFLPSVFLSIRVFFNESALHIRWPKYWSTGVFSHCLAITKNNTKSTIHGRQKSINWVSPLVEDTKNEKTSQRIDENVCKTHMWELPWWLSDDESPFQCRRHGFDPWSGRSHMLQSNQARLPQLLSLCSRARKLQLPKPKHPRACAQQQEKPTQWEVHAP